MKNLILTFAALIITLASYSQIYPEILKISIYNGQDSITTITTKAGNTNNYEYGYTDGTMLSEMGSDLYDNLDVYSIFITQSEITNLYFIIDSTYTDIYRSIINLEFDTTYFNNPMTKDSLLYDFNSFVIERYNSIDYDNNYYLSYKDGVNKYYNFNIIFVDTTKTNSINEQTKDVKNTNLYPNPVSSELIVDFETENSDMPVEVYSMNGQLLESNTDMRTTFGKNTVKINMYDYPVGMYLVRLGNVTKKVIKQ